MTIDELEAKEVPKPKEEKIFHTPTHDRASEALTRGRCPTCGAEIRQTLMSGTWQFTCKVHQGHMFFRQLGYDDDLQFYGMD